MLPEAHGSAEPPPGTHRLDVREAATWTGLLRRRRRGRATRRRWSGSGAASPTCRRTRRTTTSAPPLCSPRCTRPASRVWCWRRRWWSTARDATHARRTAPSDRGPRTAGGPRRRAVREPRARSAAGPLDWTLVDEDARRSTRAASTPRASSRRSTTPSAWARQAGGVVAALRYHNVYGRGMPRDTPYSGVAAMFRSSVERGESPQVFEDGGQMRDFVHVDDVARANLLAARRGGEASRASRRTTSARARRSRSSTWLEPWRETGRSRRSPAGTGSATCGTSWRRPSARRATSGFRAEVGPAEGLAAFRRRPAAAPDVADHQLVRTSAASSSATTTCTTRLGRRHRSGRHARSRAAARHERQPDPLHLRLAHQGRVGQHDRRRRGTHQKRTARGDRAPGAPPGSRARRRASGRRTAPARPGRPSTSTPRAVRAAIPAQ